MSWITRSKCENSKSFRCTYSVKFHDEKLEEFYWVYNCTHWACGWHCKFYSKILSETEFIKYIIVGLHFLSVLIHFLFWVLITVHGTNTSVLWRVFMSSKCCNSHNSFLNYEFSSVQSLSGFRLFATQGTAARRASLSPSPAPGACSNSMSIKSVDAIQPSHPLSSPSPPAFNLSQHQGLFFFCVHALFVKIPLDYSSG